MPSRGPCGLFAQPVLRQPPWLVDIQDHDDDEDEDASDGVQEQVVHALDVGVGRCRIGCDFGAVGD